MSSNSSSSANAGPSDGHVDSSPFPSVKSRIQQFERGFSRSFEPIQPRCTAENTMVRNRQNWNTVGMPETVERNATVTVEQLEEFAKFKDTLHSRRSTSPKIQSRSTAAAEEVGKTDAVGSNALEKKTDIEQDSVEVLSGRSTSPEIQSSSNDEAAGVGKTDTMDSNTLETNTDIEPDSVKVLSCRSTSPKTQVSSTDAAEGVGRTDAVNSNALKTKTDIEPDGAELHSRRSTSPKLQYNSTDAAEGVGKTDTVGSNTLEKETNIEQDSVELSGSQDPSTVPAEMPPQNEILMRHLEHDEIYVSINKIALQIMQYNDSFTDDELEEEEEAEPEEEADEQEVAEKQEAEEQKIFSPPNAVYSIANAALHVRVSSKSLAEGLPAHLRAYGLKVNRDFLKSEGKEENPLVQLSAIVGCILPCHENFYLECEKVVKTWNPHNPDFAGFLLQCCERFRPFITLLEFKGPLLLKVNMLRKEDRVLNKALKEFERIPRDSAKHQMEDAKRVELSTLIEQSYQTFRRYKYFMGKYSELLSNNVEEKQKAERVIWELDDIIKKMEPKMPPPTLKEIRMLCNESNGQFDELEMERSLIAHQAVSRVLKSDKLEHRYLVLSHKGLWVIRTESKLMLNSGEIFDIESSKYIELGNLMLYSYADENNRQLIKISDKSKLKTYVILLSTYFERCEWDAKFRYALDAYKATGEQKRRFPKTLKLSILP